MREQGTLVIREHKFQINARDYRGMITRFKDGKKLSTKVCAINFISGEDVEEYRSAKALAKTNEEKARLFMQYIKQPPLFEKGAFVLYLHPRGDIKIVGPAESVETLEKGIAEWVAEDEEDEEIS